MNRLIRRDENAPLARWGFFDNELDRMFDRFFRPMPWPEEAAAEALVPAMDIVEREDEYVVRTNMPGIRKENIQITLEDGMLTIAGETRDEQVEKEKGRVIRQERHYGRYVRSLRLDTHVDEKKIKATYKDGVLELVLPKAEEVKPKKISVEVE
jgi:HSP20 family protein